MATLTPPTPQWINGGALAESPESGKYELQYGYRWTQVFEGAYDLIIDNGNAGYYNRGVLNGNWIINNSIITKQRGGKGRVEIYWQNVASYVSTDEWQCQPEDQAPRVERHPYFRSLLQSDFALVQAAITAATNSARLAAIAMFSGCSNPALVNTLYSVMAGGEETYYLAGQRYTWSTYYLPGETPEPTGGGYTQTPGGPAGFILPANISWLRLADDVGLAAWTPVGGIVKLTRNWLGAPNLGSGSYWNPQIYPAG